MNGISPGNLIEASHTGPLASKERGAVRFGSRNSYETARARAMVHQLSKISLKIHGRIKRPAPTGPIIDSDCEPASCWRELYGELRFYLTERAKWKRYLSKINAAGQILRCPCFA